ncbi:hypothetical protein BDZ94DRAFT_1307997 [Collybia nuda]|uniref:Uncharacterized protein n=1 Tax=Collybia nuda TaxID=64659 RepID=A0A9P6CJM5_9AGAR|nr:hypothetical protein BDZ94DRAFT_1307997 [Collybia nuda]
MRRSMSYRKPVPEYIPSPPSSPMSPSLHLVISLDADGLVPPLPDQWRSTSSQAPTQPFSNTTFDIPRALISGLSEPQERSIPLIKVEPVDALEGNEAARKSRSASDSPVSVERPTKRRLHQQYRPPTPPLPTHHKIHRLPDNQSIVESYDKSSSDAAPGVPPSRLYKHIPSMRAASLSTIGTRTTSIQMYQAEKTYSSFGTSEPSTLWSSASTAYAGSDAGHRTLPVLPMHIVGIPGPSIAAKGSSGSNSSSWWHRIGTWGTSFRTKLKSFARVFIC